MRSSHVSVPTLVFEKKASGEEVPKLAVGCAGNAWIPVSVYNIITGVIDGKLGAQAAIEAPRFLPGRDPADPLENGERIEIEDRFPRALLQDLIDRGHKFQKIGRKGEVRYGYAAAIIVDSGQSAGSKAAPSRGARMPRCPFKRRRTIAMPANATQRRLLTRLLSELVDGASDGRRSGSSGLSSLAARRSFSLDRRMSPVALIGVLILMFLQTAPAQQSLSDKRASVAGGRARSRRCRTADVSKVARCRGDRSRQRGGAHREGPGRGQHSGRASRTPRARAKRRPTSSPIVPMAACTAR